MTRQPLTHDERAALRRAHAQAILRDEFGATLPWARLAVRFIGGIQSPLTCLTYASHLRRYFRWCLAQSLDPFAVRRSDARAYLAQHAHLAPRTRAAACTAARSFYSAAIDDEVLDKNPFDRVNPTSAQPKVRTPALTESQFADVLEGIRQSMVRHPGRLVHERDYVLVYLMGRLGPRRISVAGATWGALGAEAGQVQLTFRLKRDRYETLDVPDDVVPLLERWRHLLAAAIGRPLRATDGIFPPVGPMARVLPYRRGADAALPALTEASISWQVRARFFDVGIVGRRFSAHCLRATSATVAYEHGAPVSEIQLMLSHLNRSQTEAYIRRRRVGSAAARWTPTAQALPPMPSAGSRAGGSGEEPATAA